MSPHLRDLLDDAADDGGRPIWLDLGAVRAAGRRAAWRRRALIGGGFLGRDDGSLIGAVYGQCLQLDRVPKGFELLATSYLCRNQMMVKRSEGQLIYAVQFHLEKSFEDWNKSRTRWEHPNDSRDGRLLFENFLTLALA